MTIQKFVKERKGSLLWHNECHRVAW